MTEPVKIEIRGQVVAQKVRFDEDGNVVEHLPEVTYGGPEEIEAIVGDQPMSLDEINERLKTAEFQQECKDADPLVNPLQAWLGVKIREKESENA